MPAPQPPLILVDNIFDRINLYPLASLSWSAAVVGREGNYVADYRRERTYYQAAAAAVNQGVTVDVTSASGLQVCDSCWIDRGHNLWGKSVRIEGSNDGITWPDGATFIVPAIGTVGGDPTAGWCVTEEGALYVLLAAGSLGSHYVWRVKVTDSWAPILTGIILGKRSQLLNFSSVRDEDAGGRTERTTESDAGYLAVERTYAYRTCQLSLDLIGAVEYDTTIRSLRATLFERNQPAVIVMNYGDKPERAWLMQYQGKSWSSPMTRVHRKWTGTFREVGAVIR